MKAALGGNRGAGVAGASESALLASSVPKPVGRHVLQQPLRHCGPRLGDQLSVLGAGRQTERGPATRAAAWRMDVGGAGGRGRGRGRRGRGRCWAFRKRRRDGALHPLFSEVTSLSA